MSRTCTLYVYSCTRTGLRPLSRDANSRLKGRRPSLSNIPSKVYLIQYVYNYIRLRYLFPEEARNFSVHVRVPGWVRAQSFCNQIHTCTCTVRVQLYTYVQYVLSESEDKLLDTVDTKIYFVLSYENYHDLVSYVLLYCTFEGTKVRKYFRKYLRWYMYTYYLISIRRTTRTATGILISR